MLNNQLRTAYRQLLRHRSYTIINLAGLAVGIAVCLLIFALSGSKAATTTSTPKKTGSIA